MRPEGLRESERARERERETERDPANRRKGRQKWKMDDDKQRKARERETQKRHICTQVFRVNILTNSVQLTPRSRSRASVSMTTPWATSRKRMKDSQRRYSRRAKKAIPLHLTPGLAYIV